MLTSYVIDIPETKDILGLKRGSRTPALCSLCTAKRDTFTLSTNAEVRTLFRTKLTLRNMKIHQQILKKNQLETNCQCCQFSLSFTPFLMVGVHSSVEMYAVYRPEPMHLLCIGVSRLLKKSFKHMLSDENETTNVMHKSHRESKPFNQIKVVVPFELKKFLRLVAKQSRGFGLQADL